MIQEIMIVENKDSELAVLKEAFKEDKEYRFKSFRSDELEEGLKSIPSVIIINEDNIENDILEICDQIRSDDDNSITPVIVCSSNTEREHKMKVLEKSVEYYLQRPIDNDMMYYTIKNIVRLMYMNRRVSPLTGLPGNVQIHAELKKRITNKEEFSVLYLDLDNFKAYNDVYGFLKGDQIIEYTADTILKCIHQSYKENYFIGHIGGDDFIAIVPTLDVDNICQLIIANFDEGVTKFFTEEDLEKGYIEVANRKGIIEQFSLTSISIGAVIADKDRFANILEIGEIGAQVKHVAKSIIGSSYAVDRRHE